MTTMTMVTKPLPGIDKISADVRKRALALYFADDGVQVRTKIHRDDAPVDCCILGWMMFEERMAVEGPDDVPGMKFRVVDFCNPGERQSTMVLVSPKTYDEKVVAMDEFRRFFTEFDKEAMTFDVAALALGVGRE